MGLSRKLTLAFIFSILISILVISIISNHMINKRFDSFLLDEQEERFEIIREDINDIIIENGNITPDELLNYAKLQGLYLEIQDVDGNTICSANAHGHGRRRMMGHMRNHHNMMNTPPKKDRQGFVQKTFPLFSDDEAIGVLLIKYYDDSHLSNSSIIFKNTLAKSLMISSIIAVLFGAIISFIISRSLSNPLIEIIDTANAMREGNLKARSNIDVNTEEITELSQSINYLAQTLDEQEMLRKRYASDIAHELRTPLATLKAHVEGMIDGVWDPSAKNLHILLSEIDGLNKLVGDLRDTFNTFEGGLQPDKNIFFISDTLIDIVNTFRPVFEGKGYTLVPSIKMGIEAFMDENMLHQIISNLLTNSLNFLKKEGQVLLSLKQDKENIKITVQDNGYGIAENDLPYIFERFYRADVSRNKKTGGTGLGLSIVKSLVEANDGIIHVESELGMGTKFTLVFPIVK